MLLPTQHISSSIVCKRQAHFQFKSSRLRKQKVRLMKKTRLPATTDKWTFHCRFGGASLQHAFWAIMVQCARLEILLFRVCLCVCERKENAVRKSPMRSRENSNHKPKVHHLHFMALRLPIPMRMIASWRAWSAIYHYRPL